MAPRIIPADQIPIDDFTVCYCWAKGNSGDTGAKVSVWAYPFITWQLTGWARDGDINKPNVPVMANRVVRVHGTLDKTCYGQIFEMQADVEGMASRLRDPIRNGSNDPRFINVYPVWHGDLNPEGPDCSLLLFAARPWGPRTH